MDFERFEAGDSVRLRLAHEEIDGIYLENPDSSIVLLKLKSGYNIGISKENILAGRILKKYEKEERKEDGKNESESNKRKIGLVITGGTIASKLDSRTGGVHPLTDVNEFRKFYPELFEKAYVKKIDVPFMIASESMSSERWIQLAESVKKMLDDEEIEGIIVTHGTDTLHYTASALSFFLKNLNKPVVLTYAQKSIDRASSDANLNLVCAVEFALGECAEVVLVGHASINDDYCYALRGTKVRKMHTSRRDAFKPVNCEPIAKVYPDKIEYLSSFKKRNNGKVVLDTDYTDKVALLKVYPGQDPSILNYYALKYKGVVIEGTGLGHVPSNDSLHSWIPLLKKNIREGLVVCIVSQTINGRVDPLVYSNGRELMEAGVIFLEDMLSETALVKLGYVLGHFGWKKNVKEKMLENMSGEFNERLSE
jgi:glutamyl-tRNA(Gln) amidotransferase subunit D